MARWCIIEARSPQRQRVSCFHAGPRTTRPPRLASRLLPDGEFSRHLTQERRPPSPGTVADEAGHAKGHQSSCGWRTSRGTFFFRTTAMRIRSAILAGIAALLAACGISASPISSAASGWYAAPDRLCRLVLSRLDSLWINVDLFCVQDATGHPTYSHSTAYAGVGCIGSVGVATVYPFSGQDPGEGFVSFLGFDGAALDVIRGPDPTALANGVGAPQTWTMIRPIASPVPYTCAGAINIQPIDARSRDLVCRVNPTAPSCRP